MENGSSPTSTSRCNRRGSPATATLSNFLHSLRLLFEHAIYKEQPMKVLVFVKATANSEQGIFPPDAARLFTEMGQFNEKLVKAGIMKEADGLKPSSAGKRITFSDSGH